MKILMIIDRYIPIWGGAENQLRQLTPHLANLGCEVTIITRRWSNGLKKREAIDNTPIVRVGFPGKTFFSTISYVWGLLTYCIVNRNNIDIIHTHGAAALGSVGAVLGRLLGKPNIAKISTAGRINKIKQSLLGPLIINLFKKSSAIIAMTSEIENELLSIGVQKSQIHRISNAVDTNNFFPRNKLEKTSFRIKRGWPSDSIICIFSGRLVYRKGLDLILNIWPKITSQHKNTQLIILGSGDNQPDSIENRFKRDIKNYTLSNISLEGNVSNVSEYLGVSDLFLFPSRKEGMPNALLEAMASGLCCIASEIGGVTDLLKCGNGILIPLNDKKALTSKILEILSNIQFYNEMRDKAKRLVEKNHDFRAISSQLNSIYKDLLT